MKDNFFLGFTLASLIYGGIYFFNKPILLKDVIISCKEKNYYIHNSYIIECKVFNLTKKDINL